MSKFWQGTAPTRCDCCGATLTNHFVDGKTTQGSWANMDDQCHKQYGVGLGTGKGQRYQKQGDGRWLKVAG